MSTRVAERLEERIRTALRHLACSDVERAEAVLRTALGLPANLEAPPPHQKDQAYLAKVAEACAHGVKVWTYFADEDRAVVADALLTAAAEESSKQILDAVFKNSTVTLWPDHAYGNHLWYPIEHNPAQDRDERIRIEQELQLRMTIDATRAPVTDVEAPTP